MNEFLEFLKWAIEAGKLIIPAVVIAFITSFITVKLSIRRFHEEKWWEKKYQVYSDLLEALHHFKKYALEHLSSHETHQDIPKNKAKELTNNWEVFTREFERLHDLALFQLSPNAVKILDTYKKKKKEAENHENVYEWIDNDAAAAIECLKELSDEAKNDLKIN